MRDDLVQSLEAHLTRCGAMPFDYAAMDCARFVSEWAHVATGINHLAGISWQSEAEGRAWLSEHSLAGLPDAVSLYLVPIDVCRATMGDIIALAGPDNDPSWTPLGICMGKYSAILAPDIGVGRVRTLTAAHAWALF